MGKIKYIVCSNCGAKTEDDFACFSHYDGRTLICEECWYEEKVMEKDNNENDWIDLGSLEGKSNDKN